MPIYEYVPSGKQRCDYCAGGFELFSKSGDPRPENCPKCAAPVERKMSAPNVVKSSPSLDTANLEKHGFTQYRKSGKGVYEKTAGKGPDSISDD